MILLAVLAALLGFYRYLKNASQSRREPAVTSAPIAEAKTERSMTHSPATRAAKIELPQLEPPQGEPSGEPPSWEEMPEEQRAQHRANVAKVYDEMYARRFDLSVDEWKALSPKEQRHLIRKGKVK